MISYCQEFSWGVGLLGYTAFRIMPVVIVLAVLIYWLHQKEKSKRKEALLGLGDHLHAGDHHFLAADSVLPLSTPRLSITVP